MSSDIEAQRLQLRGAINKCNKDRQNDAVLHQQKLTSLNNEYKDKMKRLEMSQSELEARQKQLIKANSDLSLCKANFQKKAEESQRHITDLNNKIGAQQKIVNQVENTNKKIETCKSELGKSKDSLVLANDQHKVNLDEERLNNANQRSQMKESFEMEKSNIIDKHTIAMKDMQTKVGLLNTEVSERNKMIQEKQKTISNLEKEISNRVANLHNLESKYAGENISNTSTTNKLRESLNEATEQVKVSKEELNKARSMEQKAMRDNDKSKAQVESLQTRCNSHISQLTKDLETLRKNCKIEAKKQEGIHKVTIENMNDRHSQEIKRLASTISERDSKINVLEKERDELKRQISYWTGRTQSKINAAVQKYKNDIQKYETQLSDAVKKRDELLKKVENLEAANAKCNADLDGVQKGLNSCMDNSRLKDDNHKKAISSLENRLKYTESLVEEKEKKLSVSETKVMQLGDKFDQAQSDLKINNENLRSCNRDSNKCLDDLNTLKSQMKTLQNDINNESMSRRETDAKLGACKRNFTQKSSEADKIKTEKSNLLKENTKLLADIRRLNSELKTVERKVKTEMDKNNRNESSIKNMKSVIKNLKEVNMVCERGSNQCKIEAKSLRSDTRKHKTRISDMEKRIEQMTRQHETQNKNHQTQMENKDQQMKQSHERDIQSMKNEYNHQKSQHNKEMEREQQRDVVFKKKVVGDLDGINQRIQSLKNSTDRMFEQENNDLQNSAKNQSSKMSRNKTSVENEARSISEQIAAIKKRLLG